MLSYFLSFKLERLIYPDMYIYIRTQILLQNIQNRFASTIIATGTKKNRNFYRTRKSNGNGNTPRLRKFYLKLDRDHFEIKILFQCLLSTELTRLTA